MPSSVIAYYHYDHQSAILRITFVSGMVYDYMEVPENVYKAMKAARSKGTFFNRKIKDKYAFEKIT